MKRGQGLFLVPSSRIGHSLHRPELRISPGLLQGWMKQVECLLKFFILQRRCDLVELVFCVLAKCTAEEQDRDENKARFPDGAKDGHHCSIRRATGVGRPLLSAPSILDFTPAKLVCDLRTEKPSLEQNQPQKRRTRVFAPHPGPHNRKPARFK